LAASNLAILHLNYFIPFMCTFSPAPVVRPYRWAGFVSCCDRFVCASP